MAKKKIRKKKIVRKNTKKIDVEQVLLHKRQLFLFENINNKSAHELIKKLITLDKILCAPIALYINSPGGSVSAGFAIIDAIKGIRSPVVTFIMGSACSMAGLVSIAGEKRLMSKNSIWMSHDLTAGGYDYATKLVDRADFIKEEQKKIFRYLGEHTNLSKAELEKARIGELWLYPKECKAKGIVDLVVGE